MSAAATMESGTGVAAAGERSGSRAALYLVLVLAAAVLASAVSVTYVEHRARTLFVELQGLERERDAMRVEWGQLQLKQSTWATHDRIERIARRRLGLEMPEGDAIIVVSSHRDEPPAAAPR